MRITITLAVLALSSVLFLSSCQNALAQINPNSDPGAVEVGEALISPASPAYFLKMLRERIELMLGGSPIVKVTRELEFGQRRLREVNTLVKSRKQELIAATLEKYKAHIRNARDFAASDTQIQIKAIEAVGRHVNVLKRVYDQVGNPQAKVAIRGAILQAEEQNRALMGKLDSKEDLKTEVVLRQSDTCKFLAREATSSALNATERSIFRDRADVCKKFLDGFSETF